MSKIQKKSFRNSEAFSLLELLVVVAIILLLGGLLFPALKYGQTQAKISKAKSDVKQLEIAWKAVLSDYRSWTVSGVSVNNDQIMDAANIAYLQKGNDKKVLYMEFPAGIVNFMDPWKVNAYHFALGTDSISPPGHGDLYRDVGAWSYGKNKTAADVVNHVTSWK